MATGSTIPGQIGALLQKLGIKLRPRLAPCFTEGYHGEITVGIRFRDGRATVIKVQDEETHNLEREGE